jgi:ABC-type cobalamin/Fe3+-siderophores transport system ATPase subunit
LEVGDFFREFERLILIQYEEHPERAREIFMNIDDILSRRIIELERRKESLRKLREKIRTLLMLEGDPETPWRANVSDMPDPKPEGRSHPASSGPVQGAGVFFRKKKSLIERWIEGDPSAATHLCIVGRTGAGKTTLSKRIVLSLLARNETVVVFDFDSEYGDLPLSTITPPFKIPEITPWILSQISRPEEGGYGISGVVLSLEDIRNSADARFIDDAISQIRHDPSIPQTVKFAVLWRLQVLKKYFDVGHDEHPRNVRYDLSAILDVRERQAAQQILVSVSMLNSDSKWIVVEEGVSGSWLSDILVMARRRSKRIIFISQSLPSQSQLTNFEIILFTPYITDMRTFPLPLPVSPSTDKGVWWVGGLGVHRLKHLW